MVPGNPNIVGGAAAPDPKVSVSLVIPEKVSAPVIPSNATDAPAMFNPPNPVVAEMAVLIWTASWSNVSEDWYATDAVFVPSVMSNEPDAPSSSLPPAFARWAAVAIPRRAATVPVVSEIENASHDVK